jgi:hypothetical protein
LPDVDPHRNHPRPSSGRAINEIDERMFNSSEPFLDHSLHERPHGEPFALSDCLQPIESRLRQANADWISHGYKCNTAYYATLELLVAIWLGSVHLAD